MPQLFNSNIPTTLTAVVILGNATCKDTAIFMLLGTNYIIDANTMHMQLSFHLIQGET
jgi:hypothetical protein